MKRSVEVFATSTDAIQVVWRGRGNGYGTIEVDGRAFDLPAPADIGAITVRGLQPATRYDVLVDGRPAADARTLPRPAGERLGLVATVSDLHIGEIGTGHFPRLWSHHIRSEWRQGHAVWCFDAAIDQVATWSPDLIAAKGDLAHRNLPDEYDVVGKGLLRVGAPVLALGGNHDGGDTQNSHFEAEMERVGLSVDRAVQQHRLGGALVIGVDTRIEGKPSGRIKSHIETVCEAARTAKGPVLVLLHHQLMNTTVPYYMPTGVPKREARAFLDALDRAAPGAVVTSGHTHRHRARRHGSLSVTEVGSTKDYPGTFGIYEIYEGGIVQSVWRIEAPRAIAWTELTKRTARGTWGRWAPGTPSDRCFVSRAPRLDE